MRFQPAMRGEEEVLEEDDVAFLRQVGCQEDQQVGAWISMQPSDGVS